jgi:hypothetical protein
VSFGEFQGNVSAGRIVVSERLEVVIVQDLHVFSQFLRVLLPVLYGISTVNSAGCQDLCPELENRFRFTEFGEDRLCTGFGGNRYYSPGTFVSHLSQPEGLESLSS